MSFKFYPGVARGNNAHTQRKPSRSSSHVRNNSSVNAPKGKDDILVVRVNALLKRYDNNPSKREDLLGAVNLYRINSEIAESVKDKKRLKELYREFADYLAEMEKEDI